MVDNILYTEYSYKTMINILAWSRQGKLVGYPLLAVATIISIIISAVSPLPAVANADLPVEEEAAGITTELPAYPTDAADAPRTPDLVAPTPEIPKVDSGPVCQALPTDLICTSAVIPAPESIGAIPTDPVVVVGTPAPAGSYASIDPTPVASPPASIGTISGMVFHDQNGDYRFTTGEPGLQNWTIELYLFNPNADAAPIKTEITNANGAYAFTNVPAGIYIVREVEKPPRWVQTFPYGLLSVDPTVAPTPDVIVFPEPVDPVPFPTSDQNVIPEIDPIPLPNLSLQTPEIDPVPFPDLLSLNIFALRALHQGSQQVMGNSYKVTVQLNQTIPNLNFGNFAYAAVGGFHWHDLNADGIWQAGGNYPEPALPAWSITATGGTVKSATTAANGSYQFIFGSNELGTWSIAETLQASWRHTYPVNPSAYSVQMQSSGQTESDRNFGVVHYYDVAGIKFVPLSGNPSGTPEAFALDTATTPLTTNGGQTLITVPANTRFTRSDAQPLDVNAFTAGTVALSSLTGFPADNVPRAAIEWGIRGVEILMDVPVQFSFFVGTGFDGSTLNILRSTTENGAWTSGGITAPATCVVSAGICPFSANKASYYAITQTVSTPPPPPPDGGNSDTGGGGSGSITTPIPPPLPGGSGSTGGQQTPPPPPTGPGVALATFTGSSFGNSNLPTKSIGEENLEGQSEAPTSEEEPLPELNEAATQPENGGFLAAAGNILTLGTGNALIGWIIVLAILALIVYAARRRRESDSTVRTRE